MENNNSLVEHVRINIDNYFPHKRRNERVFCAMSGVDRENFLPFAMKEWAYFDEAIGIGYNQTCSQPSVVAFMLDELSIEQGNTVLEIGSGSGYAAAIASKLCGAKGKVYACEIIPELASQMRVNLGNEYDTIQIIGKDGSNGFPEFAPFDRIFLSAGVNAGSFDRTVLFKQLATPGILMYPEARGSLFKIIKLENRIEEITYGDFSFVPLTGENS